MKTIYRDGGARVIPNDHATKIYNEERIYGNREHNQMFYEFYMKDLAEERRRKKDKEPTEAELRRLAKKGW